MQKLEGWHKAVTLADKRKPNLVIMLQDFESFDPLVMQDFINICSLYHTRMRIILVMGIATSMDTFFQSFNTATIGLLRTEKFKLEQSEVWFNKVLEKVFLQSTETLKFGPRPYKFLLDRFYLYDFSISNVKASLKYALMHHYYGNPLSLFLSLLEENLPTMKKKVKGWWVEGMFTEDHILSIRMLPSFRTFVESMAIFNPKEALHILEDDEYLILNTIPMLLSHMKVYQAEFRVGIKLIQTLQAQFPTVDSIRRNVRILLLDTLQGHENTEDKINLIKLLLKLIKTMKMDQIGKLIKNLRPLFSVDEISKNGKKALEILDEWEERYKSLQNDTSSSQTDMIEGMVAGKEGGRDTETSRKVQSETLEYIKKKGSEATKFTIEIADWCETKLIQYLRPFTDLPLHELVYYTNVRLHEKSFAAEQRASIQTALIQSEHYLNCSCCNSEKADQILPSEGDTSILYKLYLECGRMINLYDWFVAFGSIVQKEHRARKKLEEKEVQARFIQSVAQLQYLGFIKPTQRKTDHVIRLTWSNI
ncbi:origin recognition complex subunit 3 N-terminus-domain-containing protein [Pilobolus umbonatus]|nr:origin recognition complex subunit 3 N-terminus-domain-containing protein [Pilobolus umbonatus]